MSIVPLRRPVAAAEPPPARRSYVSLSPAAREAMSALEAKIGELRRIFAGPSTPAAMAARIDTLAAEARVELYRLVRAAR